MKIGATIGIGTIIVVASVGGFLIYKRLTDHLSAKIAEAKRLGLPVSGTDFQLPKVPESQNGAILVNRASDMLEKSPTGDQDMKSITAAFSKQSSTADRRAGEQALKRLQPELALIVSAIGKPHCVFPFDFADITHQTFRQYAPLKAFTKAFCFQAKQLSDQGDTRGALQSLQNAHRMGRLMAENNQEIGLLVNVACDSIVEATLDVMIDRRRSDAVFLAAAEKLHDTFTEEPNLRETVKFELAYGLAQLEQLKSFQNLEDEIGEEAKNLPPIAGSDRDIAKQHLLEYDIALWKGLPQKQGDWDAAHKAVLSAEKADPIDESKLSKSTKALLEVISSSTLAEAVDVQEKLQTRRRLTDTSLRLFLKKSKDGHLPKTLPDFGLRRIDPFSGDPFKYKPAGSGFTLYGVGANRIDDGGDKYKDDVLTFE